MRVRKRLLITGRVQGVFFRDKTRRVAWSWDVAGWIRNLPDGSVEAVLEGESEAVEHLVDFCRKGPRGAVVENVEIHDEQPEGVDPPFDTRG
jgi:acylphosphatase